MADHVEKRDFYREDEINLYDYILVLWKRKYLVIAIFVVTVIFAIVISLFLPPVYRVTALLSPGPVSQGVLVDSVANIMASINEGAFNFKIIDALNLDRDKYAGMGFQTGISKGSDVIYINYDTPDPEIGKKIVSELLKQIVGFYSNRTDASTETISKTIYILKNKIVLTENSKARITNDKKKIISDIDLLKEKIELLKTTEKKLNSQIKEVNENTKIIMQDRNELFKKGDKTESVALLMYSNTIQQNISYIDRLNADLDKNKIEQETAKNELSKMGITIKNKDTELKDAETENQNVLREIEDLKFQKAKVEGIKILQEPYSSVKPSNKKKSIALAGLMSLFVGIFLAFFIEYVSKMRSTAKQ